MYYTFVLYSFTDVEPVKQYSAEHFKLFNETLKHVIGLFITANSSNVHCCRHHCNIIFSYQVGNVQWL